MVTILLLPIVAIIPDLTYLVLQKLFKPSPADFVMKIQKQKPDYVFMGFKSIEDSNIDSKVQES